MVDVSIIIPTYNRFWSLPRAIESCRKNFCKIEIIVVDDGSTDETWEWLQTQNDIVKINQKNHGQTYAVNTGTNIARGKYIRFLDSDDFLAEGIIDLQFKEAELKNADLVCNRVDDYIQETGRIIEHADVNWDDFLTVQLGNTYGSHFLGMLFKTDWVKLVPRRPDFALREDRMFILEYGLLNPRIAYLSGCAGYWVKHHNQMNNSYNGLSSQAANYQHLNIYKKIIMRLSETNDLTVLRKIATSESLFSLAEWIARSDLKTSIAMINWAKELNPDFSINRKDTIGKLYTFFGFKLTHQLLNLNRSIKALF
jgi:glycosyltransferase involved in cell wall biosynthesis